MNTDIIEIIEFMLLFLLSTMNDTSSLVIFTNLVDKKNKKRFNSKRLEYFTEF